MTARRGEVMGWSSYGTNLSRSFHTHKRNSFNTPFAYNKDRDGHVVGKASLVYDTSQSD